jgi:Restriction endonuclease
MPLPPDISNLLAVTIRDVIWYKDSVYAFLSGCGVPKPVLAEVKRIKNNTPTIKIINQVLEQLDDRGDEGLAAARKMLTTMYYWNDLHTIPHDRLDVATASLKSFREGYKRYGAQQKYEQEQQEKQMHKSRVDRTRLSDLDHETLRAFRDEFDQIHSIQDPQERGNRFQDLMNRVFNYYCEESKGAFNRKGEQIDGLFYFEKHWWYVEIRWKKEKATAADISVLRDRARAAFGGDTKALFVSFNGFSNDCLTSLTGRSDERVILMDGFDLRCILDCQIAFDLLLAKKQADIVQNKRPFVPVREIVDQRNDS